MKTEKTESKMSRGSRIGLIMGLTGPGGCLVLIVLGALLVVLFFQDAAKKCPPKDFPVYPGAQQTDFYYERSGESSRCSVGWESDAASTEVETFCEANLATGAWQLLRKDPESGLWYFPRRTGGKSVPRQALTRSPSP